MGVHRHQPKLLAHAIIKAQPPDDIPREVPVQQADARPEGRYGPRRDRPSRGVVAGVVLVAALFLGWVVWAALGAAAPDVGADVTAFTVRSAERIDVRVSAAPGAQGSFACRVRAFDRTREVVGVAGVTLDADRPGRAERWVSVRTRDRAVTATVASCAAGSAAPGQALRRAPD
jgi:hypothetical protein